MFQGQEHQPETGWDQYKWRNADPTIGRFFNVDPLAEDYMYWTPYAFSGNMVTAHRELEGLEPASINPDGTYNAPGDNVTYNTPGGAELLHEGYKYGDDPERDAAAEEFAQFLMDYTLLDEINMLYTGETANGEEAGGQDYFEAGVNFILAGAGGKGKGTPSSPKRRTASPGDKDFSTERAARRESFRQHNVPTSEANNFQREKLYGNNPNLKGSKGEPSEIIKTKDASGNDVVIDHHSNGHNFKDNNTYENPHYHGPKGQHYTYPTKKNK